VGRGGERPPPGAAKIRHASIARPFAQVGRSTLSRATDRWSSGPRGIRVSGRISKAPTRIRRGQTVSARRVRRAISTPLEYIWAHRAKKRLWTCLPPVRCNLGLPIGAVGRHRVQTVSEPLGGDYHGAARVASVSRRIRACIRTVSSQVGSGSRRVEVRTRMRSTLRSDSRSCLSAHGSSWWSW
jgi:hypothetical protein